MNGDFPKIITVLRKERGLTQKKASADLGISQALLSHYEKGARECGLDFLTKAADYYEVSTDFLLGRTARREFTPDSDFIAAQSPASADYYNKARLIEANREVLTNAADIIMRLLKI